MAVLVRECGRAGPHRRQPISATKAHAPTAEKRPHKTQALARRTTTTSTPAVGVAMIHRTTWSSHAEPATCKRAREHRANGTQRNCELGGSSRRRHSSRPDNSECRLELGLVFGDRFANPGLTNRPPPSLPAKRQGCNFMQSKIAIQQMTDMNSQT